MKNQWKLYVMLMLTVAAMPAAQARENDNRGKRSSSASEDVDVSKIKERYWARGDENEVGVVQNRLYSKSGKVELSVLGGFVNTDPFLSVNNFGGELGYHFSEYIGVNVYGWKDLVSNSAALNTLQGTLHTSANTNEPRGFAGSELEASFLYGKLSLLGQSIIYYDLHFLGGGGVTFTENGNYITPTFGLGQQIFLNEYFSFKVDFRMMPYHEDIVEKVLPNLLGQVVDSRENWTNSITFGLSVLF